MIMLLQNDGRVLAPARPATRTGWPAAASATGAVRADRIASCETPGQPGRIAGAPGQDQGGRDWRNDVTVGHRLASGQISVHAPGQPCGLCESPPPGAHLRGTRRRPQVGQGRFRRAIRFLMA